MDFIQLNFSFDAFEEYMADIMANSLAGIGFDSFVTTDTGMEAFIPAEKFDEKSLQFVMNEFPIDTDIKYEIINVPSQNWNEEWEKHYFEPIVIGEECVIHSSFHKNVPKAKYDIIIDPKMSFGTGHHETTSLVIGEILKMELSGKKLLDMGCGTSVLAILAAMRGASDLLAIDIDNWCTENSIENIALNNVNGIEVKTGGAELLAGLHFDIILANINRNILLADMEKYAACLSPGGKLYMSGFYKEDIPVIEAEVNRNGLELIDYKEKNNWVVVKTVKK